MVPWCTLAHNLEATGLSCVFSMCIHLSRKFYMVAQLTYRWSESTGSVSWDLRKEYVCKRVVLDICRQGFWWRKNCSAYESGTTISLFIPEFHVSISFLTYNKLKKIYLCLDSVLQMIRLFDKPSYKKSVILNFITSYCWLFLGFNEFSHFLGLMNFILWDV